MMSRKLRVLISALLLAPSVALGLGLGEIRLSSALNEPLSAEIDLVAATPEELATLEAQLASVEIFERYGLDRPSYLNSLEFSVGRGGDGRSVLRIRSRDAISEPFVSFLVDVSWPRGRLLREYTVLLDPPALMAADETPAAAPIAGAAASAPAPAPSPVAAEPPARQPSAPPADPAPATAPAPAAAGESTYQVAQGDTLYEIAGSLAGAADREAIQRTMIALFRTNPEAFNGNVNELRAGAILRVPPAADVERVAAAEAASEIREHNAAWRAAGGGEEAGRLRLVTPPEGEAAAEAGAPDSSARVQSQIDSLEKDIAEQRRLLELRNQELADLQAKLAESRAQEGAAAAPPEPAPPAAPEAPVDETAVAPEDDVTRPAPPPPAATPEPEAPEAEAPAPAEPSFFDRLTENWMILLGAAALLLVGMLGYGYFRRRRDEDVDTALKSFDLPASAPVPTETMRLRALATGDRTAEMPRPAAFATAADDDDEDIVVEERPVARPKTQAPRPSAGHEETISAEAAVDLDQADPLAEADFHMAYGLYDQAVDLVRMALSKAPDRTDLKLKLAEIHFVAGDTNQFLAVARDLKKSIGSGADWDRIVIMGRQLAPDESMFAGGVKETGVDLSLEGGDNLVDLDLLSAPEGEEGLDIDFGKITSDSADPTGENTAIEFNLDDGAPSFSSTQEITGREAAGTVEMPTLELPSSETPTVETPQLKSGNQSARDRAPVATDSTAEMAIDDLGLDLGNLDNLPDIDDATAIATGLHDEVTRISERGDTTQVMTQGAPGLDDEATALMPGDMDFDVGDAADDGDSAPTARDRMKTEQMPQLSQLEPVTMSEVGTKLDLARAYMDMGDPDGARNILQEVLSEGSASQKQEARRLIDTLPGA
jgi:pilus assembly protein FimV